MRRIAMTFLKEWHVIRRDPGGIAILFLMPVLLIIIMALVQDAPFKDYKTHIFKVLWIDEDRSNLSQALQSDLRSSGHFHLLDHVEHVELNRQTASQLVHSGEYSMAVLIPKGLQAELVNNANHITLALGDQLGLPSTFPTRTPRDSIRIQLYFDPVTKPDFRMAMHQMLEQVSGALQTRTILQRLSDMQPANQKAKASALHLEEKLKPLGIEEIQDTSTTSGITKMNSVQHNVPAWAIFGMFFMVIIISDNLIRERKEGSWWRLKLIPGSFSHILIGKLLFFIILGLLQFGCMLLVGIYGMPFFGLPSLETGSQVLSIFLFSICMASCVSALGILGGTLFNTPQQALPVSAISIVILSAVGGVWIPLEVLPHSIKQISVISPLRWALEGVQDIFLRHSDWSVLIQPAGILVGIALAGLWIAWWVESRRGNA